MERDLGGAFEVPPSEEKEEDLLPCPWEPEGSVTLSSDSENTTSTGSRGIEVMDTIRGTSHHGDAHANSSIPVQRDRLAHDTVVSTVSLEHRVGSISRGAVRKSCAGGVTPSGVLGVTETPHRERASGSFLLHGGSGGAAAPGASCDLQDEVYHSVVLLMVLLVTLLFLSLVLVFVSSPFL